MSHSHDHPSSASCVAKIDSKLARYAAVALLPTAATSAAVADTYHGSSSTPVTINNANGPYGYLDEAILFTAASLQFQAFAYSGSCRSAGVQIPGSQRSDVDDMKFFASASSSRVISASASADMTNLGFGGWGNEIATWHTVNLMSDGGKGYFGFSATNKNTTQTVNGWVQYSFTVGDSLELTILSWAYNIDAAITMPSNQGSSTPVPGLGGLAALACGAAGMRRKRNRVA